MITKLIKITVDGDGKETSRTTMTNEEVRVILDAPYEIVQLPRGRGSFYMNDTGMFYFEAAPSEVAA